MRFAPIDDVRLGHATVDGSHACLHLRPHAAFQIGKHVAQRLHADSTDQRVTVGPIGIQAVDIRENDQFACTNGGGQCSGGGIGVHVEHFGGVVLVRRHGGDDRDTAGVHQVLHGGGVHAHHVADQSDIGGLAVDDGMTLHGGEQAAVLAGQAHCERAVRVDQPHQFTGHLAGKHHAHHVHGVRRGHTQAAFEFGFDAQRLEHLGDLRAATMHDDRVQTHLPQEHHVFGEARLEMLVDHGVAAVFDDDALAGEFLEPRQRLDQYLRLLIGAQIGMHVEMESGSL